MDVAPDTTPGAEHTRATLLFSGNVQRVGFRYRTLLVAEAFPVTGYVRNLPDGRVELVAEGDAAAVQAFVDEVAARLVGHIADTVTRWEPATGVFDGFAVRYRDG